MRRWYLAAIVCVLGTMLGAGAAPSRVHAVVLPSGSVTDPDDDAAASPVNNPTPDLVSATVSVSGSDLLLQVRFKPGTFNATTMQIQFSLDTDRNPATGQPGTDSGCVNDSGIIGVEFIVNLGGDAGTTAEVFQYEGVCNAFAPAGSGTTTFVTDGMDATVPVAVLGATDGRLNFKVIVVDTSGVLDYMPDVGLPPGDVRSFVDVPSTHPFYLWVEALVAAGLTGGCNITPALFCPDDPVTRAQVAVFIVRGVHGAGFVPPPATGIFDDVPPGPLAPFIEQLFNDDISNGCGPSVFCPEASVTRGEIAVLLLRALGVDPPAASGTFDDVPTGHPFARWIEELVRRGISKGCGPTTFCPGAPVTREQIAAFLARAFNLPL